MKPHVEYHPENGDSPWWVRFGVIGEPKSDVIWAQRTEAEATRKVSGLLHNPNVAQT